MPQPSIQDLTPFQQEGVTLLAVARIRHMDDHPYPESYWCMERMYNRYVWGWLEDAMEDTLTMLYGERERKAAA